LPNTLLILLAVPIIGYVTWQRVSIIWQRVKQYDLLYDELERAISYIKQLEKNLRVFTQNFRYTGLQAFKVTGIQWSNPSPLLVIACNQNLLQGSKLVVINDSNLDALGRFTVVQTTSGGYLVQEDQIFNALWWGYLRDQLAQYPHPKIEDSTVAVLLH
jgi:hypothetical protein